MEAENHDPIDTAPPRTQVSFPGQRKKTSNKGLIVTILILLALLGTGVYILFGRTGENSEIAEVTPTPFVTETPVPTVEVIDRSGISIKILNGTGIPGEASKLKDDLNGLGYDTVEAANAGRSDYIKTEVTFGGNVDQKVQEEITSKLEDLYADVEVDTSSKNDKSIQIIIGYRKGFSPTPKPTKTPVTPTATPTKSATGSATVTPTNSPTPTPR